MSIFGQLFRFDASTVRCLLTKGFSNCCLLVYCRNKSSQLSLPFVRYSGRTGTVPRSTRIHFNYPIRARLLKLGTVINHHLTVGFLNPGQFFLHCQRANRVFTGLVEETGIVVSLSAKGQNSRLIVACNVVGSDAAIGDSICINGCCLTVVEVSPGLDSSHNLSFDVIPESLQRTNLGQLQEDHRVNLERSLLPKTRLGGHFVTGHIDGIATIDVIDEQKDWRTIWFKCATGLTSQMASKGSIAIDGVSLTLVDVNNNSFSVALIPYTLTSTTIGTRCAGEIVNVETDLLAKYVQRQLLVGQNQN